MSYLNIEQLVCYCIFHGFFSYRSVGEWWQVFIGVQYDDDLSYGGSVYCYTVYCVSYYIRISMSPRVLLYCCIGLPPYVYLFIVLCIKTLLAIPVVPLVAWRWS